MKVSQRTEALEMRDLSVKKFLTRYKYPFLFISGGIFIFELLLTVLRAIRLTFILISQAWLGVVSTLLFAFYTFTRLELELIFICGQNQRFSMQCSLLEVLE